MENSRDAKRKRVAKRRPRAVWQWVVGLGLLAAAAVGLLLRYVPGLAPVVQVTVDPIEIRVPAELRASDSLPAQAGELAGCNLLFVSLDTTRADRIGCYGHAGIETPTLDRLAREGVLFSNANAPAPVTLPSHSTMMTGLYPYHHGVRANCWYQLGSDQHTLAEVLRDADYATGAAISAFVLDSTFGLAQGFDYYDDDVSRDIEGVEDLQVHIPERSADRTNESAMAWLREHATQRFFLWVHYWDPHFPYMAPEPYRSEYALPYDAEIAFTDAELGRLLELVDELGLTDNTLVVVCGDHGEGLNQHDEPTHALLLYQQTLHVPLLMRCGTRLGGGVHVDRVVSLVDLMPTILALLGVAGPPDMDGVNLAQPPSGDRLIFCETLEGLTEQGCWPLLGVREGVLKYIHGPAPEMYDLSTDPFEQEDLAAASGGLAARMLGRLHGFFGDDLEQAVAVEPTHVLSDAERRKLAALGYVGDVFGEAPSPSARPDPKVVVREMRDFMPVLGAAMAADDPERSLALLAEFASEHPDHYPAHRHLGMACIENRKPDEAEAAFRRCLELRPDLLQPLWGLARVKRAQRQTGEAIALYRSVLEQSPGYFPALKDLSELLLAQGRFSEAVDELQKAFAVQPEDEAVPEWLATAMGALQRDDEAIELLQATLESSPNLPMVRNALARLLASKQEYAEAAAVLREGIRLAPEARELANNLAFILVTCRDPEVRSPMEAAVLAERICAETKYENPHYLHTLAMIYAGQARVVEALATAERARELALASEEPRAGQLVQAIGLEIERYRMLKEQGLSPMQVTPPASQPSSAEAGSDDE